MERYQLARRMLVMHKGQVARVEKVNPRWIVVQHEDGQRWNTSPASLEPAPAGSTFNLDEAEGLTLGSVVRFVGREIPDPDVFVVVGMSAGTFKVAKLGGDHGRYYRTVPASELAVIERQYLAEAL